MFAAPGIAGNVAALGGVVVPAWNPSDKAAAVTLTNANATAESASFGGVRSVTSHTTGTRYFEVNIDINAGAYPAIGVANGTASLSGGPGGDANSITFLSNSLGEIYQGGAVVTSLGAYATSAIGVEVNIGTRQIWFRTSTGPRSGPYSITATGALFAASWQASGSRGTINTGQSPFFHTPTSGFAAWG